MLCALDEAMETLLFFDFAEMTGCFFAVDVAVEFLLLFSLAGTMACVFSVDLGAVTDFFESDDLGVAIASFLLKDFDAVGFLLLPSFVLTAIVGCFLLPEFVCFELEAATLIAFVIVFLVAGFVWVWPVTEKAALIPKSMDI